MNDNAANHDQGSQAGSTSTGEQSPMSPGDEAPEGTRGTGEDICRCCGGSGKMDDGSQCEECSGTGKVTVGIGGA